jgi:hypothetical protein
MKEKVAYVKSQGQTRRHACHWPGCSKQVAPALWGCSHHWFKLPAKLRSEIWENFNPGQEVGGTPSREYIDAAKAVQAWIAAQLVNQKERL